MSYPVFEVPRGKGGETPQPEDESDFQAAETADEPGFYLPDAEAAYLEYVEARRPDIPRIQLYFVTSGGLIDAANKFNLLSDWYELGDVIDEVDHRLSQCYVATRRKLPHGYVAEWDLRAKRPGGDHG